MPYSTALKTPMSAHEVADNYKDLSDPAVMVRSLLRWIHGPVHAECTALPHGSKSSLSMDVIRSDGVAGSFQDG